MKILIARARVLPLLAAVLATALAGCTGDADDGAVESADDNLEARRAFFDGWTPANIPAGADVRTVVVARGPDGAPRVENGNGTLYAGVDTSRDPSAAPLYRSTDSGRTWQPLRVFDDLSGTALVAADVVAVAPTNPKVVYAGSQRLFVGGGGTTPGLLYRSEDGGASWREVAGGRGDLDVAPIGPRAEDHLVGIDLEGVHRSVDGGRTWQLLPGTAQAGAVEHLGTGVAFARGVDDRRVMYASYHAGSPAGRMVIRRSQDDGVSWQTIQTGSFGELVVHPADANHVYVSESGGGFFSSADGGRTLNPHNDGLERVRRDGYYGLTNVAIDTVSTPPHREDATLYIASRGDERGGVPGEVFRWDGASRWESFATAPEGRFISRLEAVNVKDVPGLIALTYTIDATGIHRRLYRASLVLR